MEFRRRFFDEGDSGGSGEGSGGLSPSKNATPNTEEGGAGGSGDGHKEPSFEEQFKTLNEEHLKLKEEHDKVTKKLGQQSQQVGTLNKFTEALKSNPKSFLQNLANQNNIKIKFDEPETPDLQKVMAEGTAEEQAKALEMRDQMTAERTRNELLATLEPVNEFVYAQKYKDWDDFTPERDAMNLLVKSGQISNKELLHLAVRGSNLDAAMEEYGKIKVQEYVDSLRKKNDEHQDASSSSGGNRSASNALFLENVLDQFNFN